MDYLGLTPWCVGLPFAPGPLVWWVTLALPTGVVGDLGPGPCMVWGVPWALAPGVMGYLGPGHWCDRLPWP